MHEKQNVINIDYFSVNQSPKAHASEREFLLLKAEIKIICLTFFLSFVLFVTKLKYFQHIRRLALTHLAVTLWQSMSMQGINKAHTAYMYVQTEN